MIAVEEERVSSLQSPGRSCPLHYRYRPEDFAVEAPYDQQDLEVLYVVGGIYGNELALARVLELFEAERGRKRLVFNGDFHWFDADPASFARVQSEVLAHGATRGNVETELATADEGGDTGCGCASPDWVGDGVVERSNRILGRLRLATNASQRAEMSVLPMWLRADVGTLRLAIVHGHHGRFKRDRPLLQCINQVARLIIALFHLEALLSRGLGFVANEYQFFLRMPKVLLELLDC
ncbi:MAG: hypothetical protein ACK5V0_09200 [Alphaproteobacteria bacterium]